MGGHKERVGETGTSKRAVYLQEKYETNPDFVIGIRPVAVIRIQPAW